jgi:hypothetical protein
MTNVSKYQQHRNGPLTPAAKDFLDKQRLQNSWSYKQLGERLGISGAFAHNILNKDMNITTNSYMPRIEEGIERLKSGQVDAPTSDEGGASNGGTPTREHSYHLRDGLQVTFRLPADLTEREGERLALFIRSLAE